MIVRTGFGYDVHKLVSGRPLILGGINIPHDKGLEGHSDADVLIHAICDALIGAVGKGDIGHHFPDTSEEFRDIASTIILEKTIQVISETGFSISNIDSTICMQKPKIATYLNPMKYTLSSIIGINQNQLNIKATTTEKLGFVGTEQGIAAYAVACIYSIA